MIKIEKFYIWLISKTIYGIVLFIKYCKEEFKWIKEYKNDTF